MGLTLKITPIGASTEKVMTICEDKDAVDTYTIEGTSYNLALVDIKFTKQMYQPCEISARIQITPYLDVANLNSHFLNSRVSLLCGNDKIASDYYVHELIPEVSKTIQDEEGNDITTLYVWFKIYSPDKLLTLERTSRAFTAKRLARDILKNEAKKNRNAVQHSNHTQ